MFVASLGLVLLVGFISGYLLNKIKLPGLIGMVLVGILFGPYALGLIDEKVLSISSELRQIALVMILTRSGLNLDVKSLKKIGSPAILMSFLPATFEICGVALASHFLLALKWQECFLLGSVLAAVSPAVVSPRMIKLIDNRLGEEHCVPKLVLAGSSVDDIFVIVVFYAFLGVCQNNSVNVGMVGLNVVISIISGIVLGIIVGIALGQLFKRTKFKTVEKVLFMLSASFLMIGLEQLVKSWISVSSLLSVLVMAIVILFILKEDSKEISKGYSAMWTVFEVLLFVLVGASVDLSFAVKNILPSLAILAVGLLFRCLGVILCLIKSGLDKKEKLFCIVAYIPKATVQASIGGIALSSGLACGAIVLTVSVLSILITAPIGAFLIDVLAKKLLKPPIDDCVEEI